MSLQPSSMSAAGLSKSQVSSRRRIAFAAEQYVADVLGGERANAEVDRGFDVVADGRQIDVKWVPPYAKHVTYSTKRPPWRLRRDRYIVVVTGTPDAFRLVGWCRQNDLQSAKPFGLMAPGYALWLRDLFPMTRWSR